MDRGFGIVGDGLLARGVAVLVLLSVLLALFVGMGATEPDPAMNDYPGADEVVVDYESYVGERAHIAGTVVATDPVVLSVGPSAFEFVVTDLERDVQQGDVLGVFGTLEPEFTISAERSVVRRSWEWAYMYAVSVLAVVLVGLRALRDWRFDVRRVAFVPRGEDDG